MGHRKFANALSIKGNYFLVIILIILSVEDVIHIIQINTTQEELLGHSASYNMGALFALYVKPILHGYLAYFLIKEKRLNFSVWDPRKSK